MSISIAEWKHAAMFRKQVKGKKEKKPKCTRDEYNVIMFDYTLKRFPFVCRYFNFIAEGGCVLSVGWRPGGVNLYASGFFLLLMQKYIYNKKCLVYINNCEICTFLV